MELGWTYFDKIRDYPEAAKWLEAAIQFPHPEYVDRMMGHAWERLPDMPKALDWYDYCIKRNPADQTAYGATLTIRERYMPAWRLMEQGKYDQAIEEINKGLLANPNSMLALHMKAKIYEARGDLKNALNTWKLAAEGSALDYHARVQVAKLSKDLGLPVPEYASAIYLERERSKTMAVPKAGE
jgi:tetratricopeptide (TPR) repeat protein